MKTIGTIALVLGVLTLAATPSFADPGVSVQFASGHGDHAWAGNNHEVHHEHWHHGWYGYPVVVAPRVVQPAVVVPYGVVPPVVAYPPVYAAPRYYPYGAPSAGFYYRSPGISMGVGF
jgi:hypothetical protein